MYPRHKYRDDLNWYDLDQPVATKKYDGAHYFVPVGLDGSLRFFSRRESVKGGFPDRTDQLPHLTDKKLPQYAGHVYSVELIHTGHSSHDIESHPAVSGILNSLKEKAIQTQQQTGPVRAVLLDVINPTFNTYNDKINHLQQFEKDLGKPHLIFTPEYHVGKVAVRELIDSTRQLGEEGVIVTELKKQETNNPRIKLKNYQTYNLRIDGYEQEVDIKGNIKQAVGAYKLVDSTGRSVGTVGSGLSRHERIDAFLNFNNYRGKVIQVKCLGITSAGKLRQPTYNGLADGAVDKIPVSSVSTSL